MFSLVLTRLGRGAAARPRRVIATWFALAVLAVLGAGLSGSTFGTSFTVPGLDSQQAADILERAGSDQAGMTAQVVTAPTDDAAGVTDPDELAALDRLEEAVAALPNVLSTTRLVSPSGEVAVLRVQYPEQNELSIADLEALKEVGASADGDGLRVAMGGDLFFAFEGTQGSPAEMIGVLVALVILVVAFGSFVAAALPIGMALLGLAVGVSAVTLLAGVMEVPEFAPVLGSMVGLGVGIDYALFVVTRHREYLRAGVPVVEAAARAVATAGRPVVLAGGVVVVSILGMAVARVPFMTAGGIAISIVVLVMVLASVTLLPAFLGLAGTRLLRGVAHEPVAGRGWDRWLGHVNRRPLPYLVGATLLLLLAAAPVTALRVGIPDDGALPPSRTERQAYDLVAQGFGPGANGPLVLAVDLRGDATVLDRVVEAVSADPGIAAVGEPVVDVDEGVAAVVAYPTTGPQDEETYSTITRLRADVLPTALAGGTATAHVGGAAANFADVGQRVNDRLPVFVAAVLALSFLLLMIMFRSVLVPLKAVLLNLLSIGAAYGVMVMVFQWGWGADLIGLESTVPIVSFIPMFMFAILFGLSMDYEVFLLSRVREEYLATGDNDRAIVRGIGLTSRVITSAALIMVAVFLSFVLGQDAATKMFGVGLATAILVDATLVRMVLVPATMTLLGSANWWFPGRARRDAGPAPAEVAAQPGRTEQLVGVPAP